MTSLLWTYVLAVEKQYNARLANNAIVYSKEQNGVQPKNKNYSYSRATVASHIKYGMYTSASES